MKTVKGKLYSDNENHYLYIKRNLLSIYYKLNPSSNVTHWWAPCRGVYMKDKQYSILFEGSMIFCPNSRYTVKDILIQGNKI